MDMRSDDVGDVANETVRSLIMRFGDQTDNNSNTNDSASPTTTSVNLQMPIEDLPTQTIENKPASSESGSNKLSENKSDQTQTMVAGFIDPAQLTPNTILGSLPRYPKSR
jgi:hypothetical protein